MSKTIMWVVIVCVVAVGGYFIYNSSSGENDTKIENEADTKEEAKDITPENAGKKMAFSEFVKQGGNYKCTVKQAVSDFDTRGTVYINGDNMRGEFNTVAEGRPVDTYFIFKDGYMYNWSSLAQIGVKTQVIAAGRDASATTEAEYQATYLWNAKQIGDYNCEAWTVDSSIFTAPSGVTFTER